jgi:predicted RNA binding protein YcfA (HicA-like mRNA interferase family)
MKRGDVIRHLRAAGCLSLRDTGRHEIYHNPATGMQSPVPRHGELDAKIVRKICKELGIERPLGR